ncbi:MAG: hypothetical protein Q4C54_06490 [Clostridia bacterium]|nr:hypothetical protein [Clostridia bacterium]
MKKLIAVIVTLLVVLLCAGAMAAPPDFTITAEKTDLLYGGMVTLHSSEKFTGRIYVNVNELNSGITTSQSVDLYDSVDSFDWYVTAREDCELWVEDSSARCSNKINLKVTYYGTFPAIDARFNGEPFANLSVIGAYEKHTVTVSPKMEDAEYYLSCSFYDASGNDIYESIVYRGSRWEDVNNTVFTAPYSADSAYIYIAIQQPGYEPFRIDMTVPVAIPAHDSFRTDNEKHYGLDASGNVLWEGCHTALCGSPAECAVCQAANVQIADTMHAGSSIKAPLDSNCHHNVCSVCREALDSYKEPHQAYCGSPSVCADCGQTGITAGEVCHDYAWNMKSVGKYQHYDSCTLCGSKLYSTHTAACTSPTTCDECGASGIIPEYLSHSSWEMQGDASKHRYRCTGCGLEGGD